MGNASGTAGVGEGLCGVLEGPEACSVEKRQVGAFRDWQACLQALRLTFEEKAQSQWVARPRAQGWRTAEPDCLGSVAAESTLLLQFLIYRQKQQEEIAEWKWGKSEGGLGSSRWEGTQPSGTRAHVARGGADCVPVPWTSRKTCRMTQYEVPRQGLPCGRGTAEVECNGAMDSNGGAPGHDVKT